MLDYELDPKTKRPKDAVVVINYGGILAERLEWNESALQTFAQKADLRTRIKVTTGYDRDQVNYTNLGEVLVWRKLADPRIFFQSPLKTAPEAKSTTDVDQGYAILYLNDQVIADRVRSQNNGVFSQEAFARRLNEATTQGLKNIIGWEKGHQRLIASVWVIFDGLNVGATSFIGYWSYHMGHDFFQFLITDGNISWGNLIGGGLGASFTGQLINTDIQHLKAHRILSAPPGRTFRYRTSLWDDNPLKHLKNELGAKRLLKPEQFKIVTLKPNEPEHPNPDLEP